MGNGVRKLNHCFAGEVGEISLRRDLSDPLVEGLGHSFCYIRPECSSKVHSSDEYIASAKSATTTFRTISGASISANTSTPLSTALLDLCPYNGAGIDKASAFESSDSFASIPLQPIPKTSIPSVRSGPIPRSSGIISGSGPIERGFLSGPIERSFISGPLEHQLDNQLQRYKPKSKKWTAIKNLKKAISKSIVLPLRVTKELNRPNGGETVNNNENCTLGSGSSSLGCDDDDDVNRNDSFENRNVQWAQGKAGEDRVHIVISEENGWVFVGIYDGFNGPDATDFLLNNLYFNVYNELKGILWDDNHDSKQNGSSEKESTVENDEFDLYSECDAIASLDGNLGLDCKNLRKVGRGVTRNSEESRWNGKGTWDKERVELDSKLKENLNDLNSEGEGTVNGSDVLRALSEALKKTEKGYLEIADMMVMENPELALMGSCVLVMLMKGEDVYLMNVGDSRAVLACEAETDFWVAKGGKDLERIREETLNDLEAFNSDEFDSFLNLTSQQLTVDHCTSAEEEVHRIKKEHPDDASAVMNDRVKGSLKVTRAFGAGFLKQPKWNNALLETFKVDYVGTSAYINCIPSLHHHRLGPRDKFLILSSDGLYQYFTDEEAVSEVEMFISTFPEGDPAQHLVEEVLFRAAKRAGMDFHELLDIPQGDRRRYHDDVSIIIISFEGWIWRSSV